MLLFVIHVKEMASRENLTFEYTVVREVKADIHRWPLMEGTGVKRPSDSSRGFSHSAIPPCFGCVHEAFSVEHSKVSKSFHTK